jgi:hypothetical protein
LAAEPKCWHIAILSRQQDILVKLVRNWEMFDVEHAVQEEIGRCALYPINYWMFGNVDRLIEALPDNLQALLNLP